MNVLNAIGGLGRDSELRFTNDKTPVLGFSLAITSGYGDNQVTTWLNCSLWGKRAETLAPMLKKGNRVGVTGELTNREYPANDGSTKYSLNLRVNEVTLIERKADAGNTAQPTNQPAPAKEPAAGNFDDFDDDIPF